MKVLDIILEQKSSTVFVFGDSIAVGIKNAANADGSAKGGETAAQVLARIEDFISTRGEALVGATVILSSGASNSTFERKNGDKKNLDTAPIARQISTLKAAGAKNILLVGTGSEASKWMTNRFGEYRVNFKDQQVNDKLSSVASSAGAKFLGPLEAFDPSINSAGDGIHMSPAGYKSLYQTAVGLSPATATDAPAKKPKQGAQAVNTVATTPGKLAVPTEKWHGEDTRAIQQALIDLGYEMPKHGADSYFGPETARAVRKFQQDNGLKVDGDPGPETVAKLNALAGKKTPEAPKAAPGASPTAPAAVAPRKAAPKQGAMVQPMPAKTKGGAHLVDKKEVSNYLKSKRMSGNHRIGILANIAGESGFNSANINPNDNGMRAIGLFQHRGDRDQKLEAAVPDWRTNWKGQIDFALSEPAGRRYLSTKFKTYEQAVEQWVRDFERPKDAWGDTVKRIAVADDLVKNNV